MNYINYLKNLEYVSLKLEKVQDRNNLEKLEKINEMINDLGVEIKTGCGDKLEIYIDKEKLEKIKTRNAGRKNKIIVKEKKAVKRSDVIEMLKTMNDKEIMEKLEMKPATYYRHKKKMLEEIPKKNYKCF